MTSRGKGKGGKSGRLSKEDKALWDVFSRKVTPLSGNARVRKSKQNQTPTTDSRETSTPGEYTEGPKQREVRQPVKEAKARSVPKPREGIAENNFDQKAVRRLKSGRGTIDGRIDLHGMRQTEAHAALKRFLFAAAARGYRTVLIITGKGVQLPDAQRPWSETHGEERGVLRRMVPLWLAEPALRGLVIGHAPASPRHGGDGALYVQLRAKPKKG